MSLFSKWTQWGSFCILFIAALLFLQPQQGQAETKPYVIVDTSQDGCYDENGVEITCPIAGQDW